MPEEMRLFIIKVIPGDKIFGAVKSLGPIQSKHIDFVRSKDENNEEIK